MRSELKRAVPFTIVTMALFGGGYHLLACGVGQALFPGQAEGGLIRRSDGTLVGSSLIAQGFSRSEYFHPRPSAVDYDAASSGGSNLGPSNPDQLKKVHERLEAVTALEGAQRHQVSSEMLTASGSGLDPHISPEAADLQARRVAAARDVPIQRIQELIQSRIQGPALGFLGRPVVNVLELNLALDSAFPPRPAGAR